MSLTISIRFLTGRAHLHHWQAHHSDGKVDWPPSPWRLLRAVVAVAGRSLTTLPEPDFVSDHGKKPKKTKSSASAAWPSHNYLAMPDEWHGMSQPPDEIPLSRLGALLASLSGAPEIWLPKTAGGHTRQFFPIHEAGIVKPSGSAVFDTFAIVPKDQPVFYYWPNVTLPPHEEHFKDLTLLLQGMTYFGRAESWCQAQVVLAAPDQVGGVQQGITHWPCGCIEDGFHPRGREHHDYTLERKLAPLLMNGDEERSLPDEASQLLPCTKPISPTRPKEEGDFRALLQTEFPGTLLLRCLLRESGQDMKDSLERPIGTRWVHYAVPREIFRLQPPVCQRPARKPEFVQIIRFSLNTASIHRPVLPLLTDTLIVADQFRRAALALYCAVNRDTNGFSPRNLCGREEDGSLCRDHDHAFFWPLDEDNDGFIDHVMIYCPGGFRSQEVDAVRRLCRIRQRGGRPDLLVTPVFIGSQKDFPLWQPNDEKGRTRVATTFVSATPYFCPVHLTHGKGSKGRTRPLTREIIKSLLKQRLIDSEDDLLSIREIVFDHAMDNLAEVMKASEPIPDPRFSGALPKDPDAGFPFGLSIGLLTGDGTRFVRAMSFCQRRRHHQTKGHGRMLQIVFSKPRIPRPFAIGDQCHFGLGLFVPTAGQ